MVPFSVVASGMRPAACPERLTALTYSIVYPPSKPRPAKRASVGLRDAPRLDAL